MPDNLKEAIKDQPEVATELSPSTLWRYCKGEFPDAVKWFFRHPELFAVARKQHLQSSAASEHAQGDCSA